MSQEKMEVIKILPEGIYREENGKKIFGKSIFVFIHNLDYYLAQLKIYEDGKIGCWGLVDFEEFKKKINEGWIKTIIPEGSRVSVFPLGKFYIKEPYFGVKEEELIKEVQDIINELNNKPSTSELCYKAYKKYDKNSTEKNKMDLKVAYENIPEHNRRYVLSDMDLKDSPIREIIY